MLVKFTTRYNPDAHRLLAAAGLAPHLYSCSYVYGGLYMVVMEFISGEVMEYLVAEKDKTVPLSVFDDVKAAIEKLHEKDIVFGDLRPPNIMCSPKSEDVDPGSGVKTKRLRAKLVDFDWASIDGEGRYTATLHDDEPEKWVNGVGRYEVMRKEHDLGMLEKLPRMCA